MESLSRPNPHSPLHIPPAATPPVYSAADGSPYRPRPLNRQNHAKFETRASSEPPRPDRTGPQASDHRPASTRPPSNAISPPPPLLKSVASSIRGRSGSRTPSRLSQTVDPSPATPSALTDDGIIIEERSEEIHGLPDAAEVIYPDGFEDARSEITGECHTNDNSELDDDDIPDDTSTSSNDSHDPEQQFLDDFERLRCESESDYALFNAARRERRRRVKAVRKYKRTFNERSPSVTDTEVAERRSDRNIRRRFLSPSPMPGRLHEFGPPISNDGETNGTRLPSAMYRNRSDSAKDVATAWTLPRTKFSPNISRSNSTHYFTDTATPSA